MTRKDELYEIKNSVSGEVAQAKALYLGLCQIADAIVLVAQTPLDEWHKWTGKE